MYETTPNLVRAWKQYIAERGDPSIIRAIEVELMHRPVRERLSEGYPK